MLTSEPLTPPTPGGGLAAAEIPAAGDVRTILGQHVLTDGLDLVLDLARSSRAHLVDEATGTS